MESLDSNIEVQNKLDISKLAEVEAFMLKHSDINDYLQMKQIKIREYVDVYILWESIDDFTYSIILSKEKDLELEAKATTYIGKIQY